MQRFLLSAAGVLAVVIAFTVFTSSQTGSPLNETLQEVLGGAAATAAPDESANPEDASTLTPGADPSLAAGTPAAEARAALENIPVTPATRVKKYERELFGTAWADVDGNGCDTRNDILARDLDVTSMEGSCIILTGTLHDPYTGKTIDFVRGKTTSAAVQIDHIVSASAAWKGGAHAWTDEQRLAFANDPANLLATDGPTNGSKNDLGPAAWMPSAAGNAGYDCTYAISYTSILVSYQLSAPAADIAALRDTLLLCA